MFFSKTKIGRGLRAVADDHQAALSVGISLNQIWVIVWFVAGIVALVTGIFWGALFLGENIDQKVILGSIFILLGIGLTNIFVPKKLLRD